MPFQFAVVIVRGGLREVVNDADRPEFLKRELMGLSVDGYQ